MTNTKITNTAGRLREIMAKRGLRNRDIVELCAPYSEQYHIILSKADVSLYVNGKVEPNQGKLFILGKALNVSEAWLMGYDVPIERLTSENEPVPLRGDVLIDEISKLDERQRNLLLNYVELLLSAKR